MEKTVENAKKNIDEVERRILNLPINNIYTLCINFDFGKQLLAHWKMYVYQIPPFVLIESMLPDLIIFHQFTRILCHIKMWVFIGELYWKGVI